MFGKLKEKFTSWFKKSETAKEEPLVETPKKERPQKKTKKTAKTPSKKSAPKIPVKSTTLEEPLEKTPSQKQTSEEPLPAEPVLEEPPTPETEEPPQESTATQEPKEEKQGFFAKLKTKLSTSILKQEEFDEIFSDLEITLLENNVALEVVDKIRASLSKDLVGISIKKSQIDETILSSLKESITQLLIDPPDLLKEIKKSLEPYVILFFGINGSGKTTTVAKLAHYLKSKNISCVLAAADTFRAASIEQLETHAASLKVPIVKSKYGADPASVAFEAISYAKKNKIRCVLIDTAGRMYTKSNLLKEMEKIVRISKPNLKIFVGESITGNDATEQAKTFNETAGIDGIILSKADVDEKAGTILSVSQVTNKPIYFLGTGQKYEDLEPFTKKTVLKNLGLE